MGIRSVLAKPFAAYIASETKKWSLNPEVHQQRTFQYLVREAKGTIFGRDHQFNSIRNYDDFRKNVPVRDYEELKPYVEQLLTGKPDVLWKGKPEYFAKTSGTTSGSAASARTAGGRRRSTSGSSQHPSIRSAHRARMLSSQSKMVDR